MRQSMQNLVGKVALLVGEQWDNGVSLATDLARQGCDIVLVYADVTRPDAEKIAHQVKETGQQCLLISETVGAKRTVQYILHKLGRLDIFIHYATKGRVDYLQTIPLSHSLFPDLTMTKMAIRQLAAAGKV